MTGPRLELSATAVLALAGVAVAGVLAWRAYTTGREVAELAGEVIARDLNPASSDNLVNRAVTGVGATLTGDPNWTLGGAIFDLTHNDPDDPSRNTVLDPVNPASERNVVNQGLQKIGRSISGDPTWTLGGWIYDMTNERPKP